MHSNAPKAVNLGMMGIRDFSMNPTETMFLRSLAFRMIDVLCRVRRRPMLRRTPAQMKVYPVASEVTHDRWMNNP